MAIPGLAREVKMDPDFVTTQVWHQLSLMLRFLWVYVFFIIGFAFNFLLAHAVIPSLVDSGQLPARIARLRPLFYLSALGSLTAALLFAVLTAVNADVTQLVLKRWWI